MPSGATDWANVPCQTVIDNYGLFLFEEGIRRVPRNKSPILGTLYTPELKIYINVDIPYFFPYLWDLDIENSDLGIQNYFPWNLVYVEFMEIVHHLNFRGCIYKMWRHKIKKNEM